MGYSGWNHIMGLLHILLSSTMKTMENGKLGCRPISEHKEMILHPKKTAIEEARDIDTLSLADLSGALQTYELELRPVKKANMNLALKVIKEEDDDCNEIDMKQLALITRHFQKLLKKQNSKGSGSSTRSPINKTSKDGSQRFIPKSEGRKCYACSGYGHEDKECANTISKQKEEKKAMKASYNSWSDSESNMFEVEEEEIAFVALENNDEYDDSYEEDVVIEETRERYKELYLNFDKVKKQNDGLKIKVSKKKDEWQRTETSLRSQVNNLLAERDLLKEKLKEAEKKLHRLII
ncbi:PREDICTED: zf-CCHC domain-containing [Prunus dulcis]|uniref:PREDICTED: zf-CCHC domain-containing n=1 Tax=Prunus dulcis TaxID=3755 RepID=A0A5E4GBC3_PRUDU|nr:PREDICTED: zf-CCHC domain-containing [Prunus dulcis]